MDIPIIINQRSAVADTIEVFYTSPPGANGTIVKAFSAVNDTGINKSYKGYIYDSAGLLVSAIIPFKVVIRDRFDLGSSIINQTIPEGGTLRIESSTADGLLFYATGKQQ